MQHTTIAVDVAKSVFQIAISHHPGRVDEEHRLSRARFLPFFANHPPSTVLLEACGSAHHWGRALTQLGHTVRLLPPHETRRYVRRTKTDRTDARALLEAARNEEIHAVPIKSETQQAVASLHRIRATWLRTRTARINTLRGLLREFGITIPVGRRHVVPRVNALIADADSPVPMSLRTPLAELCDEIFILTHRLKELEHHLAAVAEQLPQVALLRTIPGIGLLNATALAACVGDVRRFPTGRHFASYLGLTPREHSSGGRRRLGGITKQGDQYLRTLLMHAARGTLSHSLHPIKPSPFRTWARTVAERRGSNIATAAIANRLARMVWRVCRDNRPFVVEGPVAA
jgi:transposase